MKHGRKGLGGTISDSLLKYQIPIRMHNWDITQPGIMEADTVAHCGNGLAGDLDQTKDIQARLPFELKGFDCDNGSEFLNYHLLR